MAKLYYRYGAMGSSKSANILMVRYNYEEREQYAVLLKPKVDNRDGERVIQSRIGLSAPAGYVDEFLEEIADVWKKEDEEHFYHGQKVDAVLVDEAQFLTPEEVDILSDLVDFYEIPVICYGLRTDFMNRLFPGSRRLMEIADVIEEVPTVCWCGRRAQYNTRYADGKIVNMDLAHNDKVKFVVMSFDAGTGLSEHAAPGEALVMALDGEAVIGYEGQEQVIHTGETFKFDKFGKHSVSATKQFKMALLLVLE